MAWFKSAFFSLVALSATSVDARPAANPVSFDLEWAIIGQVDGPQAPGIAPSGPDATATLTVDSGLLTSAFDFFFVPPEGIPILSFQLNILNGAVGPDQFLTNDLFYSFSTLGPIDPNTDLLSQQNFQDFNVFDPDNPFFLEANEFGPQLTDTGFFPNGVENNTFQFGDDVFEMTSFAPSEVPLPAPLAMLLAGLAGLVLLRRRAA